MFQTLQQKAYILHNTSEGAHREESLWMFQMWKNFQCEVSIYCASEDTDGTNPVNVPSVGKLSVWSQNLLCTREHTHRRETLWMYWIWDNFKWQVDTDRTSEITHKRDPLCVLNVGKPSMESQNWLYTREHTLQRNVMNVLNVGKP